MASLIMGAALMMQVRTEFMILDIRAGYHFLQWLQLEASLWFLIFSRIGFKKQLMKGRIYED
jgi:hypothetical protein